MTNMVWEGRLLFHLKLVAYHSEKSGRELKWRPWRSAAHGRALPAQGWLYTVAEPPTQSPIKKMPTGQPSGAIFLVGLSFSKMTLACVELT